MVWKSPHDDAKEEAAPPPLPRRQEERDTMAERSWASSSSSLTGSTYRSLQVGGAAAAPSLLQSSSTLETAKTTTTTSSTLIPLSRKNTPPPPPPPSMEEMRSNSPQFQPQATLVPTQTAWNTPKPTPLPLYHPKKMPYSLLVPKTRLHHVCQALTTCARKLSLHARYMDAPVVAASMNTVDDLQLYVSLYHHDEQLWIHLQATNKIRNTELASLYKTCLLQVAHAEESQWEPIFESFQTKMAQLQSLAFLLHNDWKALQQRDSALLNATTTTEVLPELEQAWQSAPPTRDSLDAAGRVLLELANPLHSGSTAVSLQLAHALWCEDTPYPTLRTCLYQAVVNTDESTTTRRNLLKVWIQALYVLSASSNDTVQISQDLEGILLQYVQSVQEDPHAAYWAVQALRVCPRHVLQATLLQPHILPVLQHAHQYGAQYHAALEVACFELGQLLFK